MRKKYDTDLTDEQWNEIAPLFVGMRKYKWEKRELLDEVFYLLDSGCIAARFFTGFYCSQFLSPCKTQRTLGQDIGAYGKSDEKKCRS